MTLTIAWLPAHPDEGSVSMLRHWQCLRAALPAGGDLRVIEALPPAETAPRAGRLRRAWSKRIAYPCRVALLPRADVYHLLDHSFAHLLPFLPRRARVVATVHDLAPLDDPGSLTPAQLRRFRRTVACLRRATRLVADSQFTAQRLARHLDLEERSITVLPLGVEAARFARSASRAGPPYVVSIGSCQPRKNLGLLPAVLGRVAQANPGLRLVRIGDPLPVALRQELDAVLAGRVDELGFVDDRVLADYYAGALALLFPSRIEGFGLPVLEAMAAGCPVVCSRAASLPEVGGDAALYFEPDNAAAAAGHLLRLATDHAGREELIAAGRTQAARFSWAAHAARLIDLYREVAAG